MIDLSFKITAEQFKLSLDTHNSDRFIVRYSNGERTIVCPQGTNFQDVHIQAWLRKVVEEMLRKQAQDVFPKRLSELAREHGFSYKQVRIKNMKTRWGSCSSLGNINLSCYLILVPKHLSDYVMLHELCHTREMNHGKGFWRELNNCTGGKADALRNELRPYIPYIEQRGV